MNFDKKPVYVDASASSCPGPTEYRGIYCGNQLFSVQAGHTSVNVGEFLAIVHALRICNGFPPEERPSAIYSDSETALAWVRRKKAKTAHWLPAVTEAEEWLKSNTVLIPVVQWHTKIRGDIPADYGKKAKATTKAKSPKYNANFLWGFEDGSVEALGYEFANAKTEKYQKECWNALLEAVSQSARDKLWREIIIDQRAQEQSHTQEQSAKDMAVSVISQIKDDLIKIDNPSFQLEYLERIEVFLSCAKSICKPEVITEEEKKSILKTLNIDK